jgi:hypothetical protein
MRCTSCVAAVVNKAADRLGLPFGGYGYLGVCNDSVAMVQAGLGEQVTQFPCILAGAAKVTVSQTFEVRKLVYTAHALARRARKRRCCATFSYAHSSWELTRRHCIQAQLHMPIWPIAAACPDHCVHAAGVCQARRSAGAGGDGRGCAPHTARHAAQPVRHRAEAGDDGGRGPARVGGHSAGDAVCHARERAARPAACARAA